MATARSTTAKSCDDGNTDDLDACGNDCDLNTCGDGEVNNGEACDDGNTDDLDACGNDCLANTCGDGEVNNGESCDDGNTDDLDACGNDCELNTCGDGEVNNGEACDDGNTDDLDACGNDCIANACGDGKINNGEACDDGNTDDLDACGNDCLANACGDGEVNNGEACDDGNTDDLDACGNDCLANTCGDGEVNNGEACDDGNTDDLDACGNDCIANTCGDGEVNNGESCDDGNTDDLDACGNDCELNTCGDSEVNNGESCDDGNSDDLDACGNDCQLNTCGDGEINNGEACDDGNTDDLDACGNDCELNTCGDGEVNNGEACDDGNTDPTDECDNCNLNLCGNGFVDGVVGEECDDSNRIGGDGCSTTCELEDTCGLELIRTATPGTLTPINDLGCDELGKPTQLTFLYSGSACPGVHQQGEEASCEGSIDVSQAVSVVTGGLYELQQMDPTPTPGSPAASWVTGSNTAGHPGGTSGTGTGAGPIGSFDEQSETRGGFRFKCEAYTVVPASVAPGETFTIYAGSTGFCSNSYIQLSNGGGIELSKFTTGCTEPLRMGNAFGASTLVGFNDELADLTEVMFSYTVVNHGDTVQQVSLVDDHLGVIAEGLELARGESVEMTETRMIVSDFATNAVVNGTLLAAGGGTCSASAGVSVSLDTPSCPAERPIRSLRAAFTGEACTSFAGASEAPTEVLYCDDALAATTEVRILVTDRPDFQDPEAWIWFDEIVSRSDPEFEIDSWATGAPQLGETIYVHVLEAAETNPRRTQIIEIDGSCSAALEKGDEIGSIRIEEILLAQ